MIKFEVYFVFRSHCIHKDVVPSSERYVELCFTQIMNVDMSLLQGEFVAGSVRGVSAMLN